MEVSFDYFLHEQIQHFMMCLGKVKRCLGILIGFSVEDNDEPTKKTLFTVHDHKMILIIIRDMRFGIIKMSFFKIA